MVDIKRKDFNLKREMDHEKLTFRYSEFGSKMELLSETIQSKSSFLTNDQIARVYALYKQVHVGDNMTQIPAESMSDALARLKWQEWDLLKGMSRDEAIHVFIEEASKIIETVELSQ